MLLPLGMRRRWNSRQYNISTGSPHTDDHARHASPPAVEQNTFPKLRAEIPKKALDITKLYYNSSDFKMMEYKRNEISGNYWE
jgi:hypothetical protein